MTPSASDARSMQPSPVGDARPVAAATGGGATPGASGIAVSSSRVSIQPDASGQARVQPRGAGQVRGSALVVSAAWDVRNDQALTDQQQEIARHVVRVIRSGEVQPWNVDSDGNLAIEAYAFSDPPNASRLALGEHQYVVALTTVDLMPSAVEIRYQQREPFRVSIDHPEAITAAETSRPVFVVGGMGAMRELGLASWGARTKRIDWNHLFDSPAYAQFVAYVRQGIELPNGGGAVSSIDAFRQLDIGDQLRLLEIGIGHHALAPDITEVINRVEADRSQEGQTLPSTEFVRPVGPKATTEQHLALVQRARAMPRVAHELRNYPSDISALCGALEQGVRVRPEGPTIHRMDEFATLPAADARRVLEQLIVDWQLSRNTLAALDAVHPRADGVKLGGNLPHQMPVDPDHFAKVYDAWHKPGIDRNDAKRFAELCRYLENSPRFVEGIGKIDTLHAFETLSVPQARRLVSDAGIDDAVLAACDRIKPRPDGAALALEA